MKKVLWISRHEMTPEQFADLEARLGERVSVTQWRDTVKGWEPLRPLIAEADVVAAVLPLELYAQLLTEAGERPVIQAVSGREPTGRTLELADGRREPEFRFAHRLWQRVVRVEVETRPL